MTEKDRNTMCKMLQCNNIVEIQFVEWGDKPKLVVLPFDGSDFDSSEEYIIAECKKINDVSFKSIDLIKKIFPNIENVFYYTSCHNVFGSKGKEIVNDEQLYFIIPTDAKLNIEDYWDKDLGFCELLS
jgi:hypothetical protein